MKTIFEGKTEAKRGRGRPSLSYVDQVSKVTGLKLQSISQKSQDRVIWRGIVKSSCAAANINPDDAFEVTSNRQDAILAFDTRFHFTRIRATQVATQEGAAPPPSLNLPRPSGLSESGKPVCPSQQPHLTCLTVSVHSAH
ncbi:hypothetical protein ElyMa_005094400 [Elysia marginata]|uniref:Uncharacterized protein n=1 Tax=Elysia marginata TaxID=1093978 RepID=A0AAV4JMT4_9GAST|nr:hypothetical protein ElyMa_005094400 [Elysia marginata]